MFPVTMTYILMCIVKNNLNFKFKGTHVIATFNEKRKIADDVNNYDEIDQPDVTYNLTQLQSW